MKLALISSPLCGSRKHPYLPHGKDFFQDPPTPPPLWKFRLNLIHFFKFFGLREPPHSPGNSNPFCWVGGGVWIFSGTAHFGKCAVQENIHTPLPSPEGIWKEEAGRASKTNCPLSLGSRSGSATVFIPTKLNIM